MLSSLAQAVSRPQSVRASFSPGDYPVLSLADGTRVVIAGHQAAKGTFDNYCRAMGRLDLLADPELSTVALRLANLDRIRGSRDADDRRRALWARRARAGRLRRKIRRDGGAVRFHRPDRPDEGRDEGPAGADVSRTPVATPAAPPAIGPYAQAVIANGMVFVGSGYVGFQNGVPGNVLLAFAPSF